MFAKPVSEMCHTALIYQRLFPFSPRENFRRILKYRLCCPPKQKKLEFGTVHNSPSVSPTILEGTRRHEVYSDQIWPRGIERICLIRDGWGTSVCFFTYLHFSFEEPDMEASTDVKSSTKTLTVVLKAPSSSNALLEPTVTVKPSSPHPKADRRFSLQVDKVPAFASGTHRRLSALLQRLQPRRGSMFEIKEGEEANQSSSSASENRKSQRRHSHAPASGRRRPSVWR